METDVIYRSNAKAFMQIRGRPLLQICGQPTTYDY